MKPFVDLHSCLKVLAIASILRKRGVRKSAADEFTCSVILVQNKSCFLPFREGEVAPLFSQILHLLLKQVRLDRECFPTPHKKIQLALEINLLSQEKQNSPSKGRDSKFYCLSERERAHLLSDRETFPLQRVIKWKEKIKSFLLH